MIRSLVTLAILPALTAAAWAQDGGKLDWKGRNQDNATAVLEEATHDGRPILMFFSVDGNPDCINLCSGAFSHPAVIEAATEFTCVFVDCSPTKKNAMVAEKLQITKFPKLFFCTIEGTPIAELQQRDGPALAAAMHDFADRVASRPNFTENIAGAIQTARKTKLPVLLYFYDDSAASLTISKSLLDQELAPLRTRFVGARARMKKDSDVCVRFDVSRAPTLLVLDPQLPKPEEKPLARIATSRSPRELRRDLEEALSTVAPPLKDLPAISPSVPTPKEPLSDDEIDRKFIQARINVALDLIKRGMKDKAIEVLDDVLRTFPKHVLTPEARTLLEQLKK